MKDYYGRRRVDFTGDGTEADVTPCPRPTPRSLRLRLRPSGVSDGVPRGGLRWRDPWVGALDGTTPAWVGEWPPSRHVSPFLLVRLSQGSSLTQTPPRCERVPCTLGPGSTSRPQCEVPWPHPSPSSRAKLLGRSLHRWRGLGGCRGSRTRTPCQRRGSVDSDAGVLDEV